ncbi:MAG: nitrous oxide reductase family maturation protein NosD [Gammaproteobacteria bacterium]|nr:nitrous oxide reductase family maturation protein NosD [Gammaproteobacteria bacterium]MBU1654475.1 nitrous oxide reductase family maturation protein NosD [Gammaproteobacteria bacterium]MBU1962633.1 nitrous oxide reductase family maturation protein NosD [Gammaproteobacteria bacterium]
MSLRPPLLLPLLFCLWGTAQAQALPSLQKLVDAAEPNSTLTPPPGVYAGPVVIDKPLVLDGQNQVTIDGGGKGTVILLDTDSATVKNLRLTNSGNSHNDLDSGIQVRGDFNVIKDNRIDNCLFGIDLQQSKNNLVRRNRISSKDVELGVRGDAIRLWYSFNNKIEENVATNSRDIVVWYSRDNLIRGNKSTGGRYSLHFMYSQYNLVENNDFRDNSVGIFIMYSDGIKVRGNRVFRATGPTGVGIGFKETSSVEIDNNEILYCATGLDLDVSPFQPDTTNLIRHNLIAYNAVGVRFLNDWTGNIFEGNLFKGNLTQVAVNGGKSAKRNIWRGNHWDEYQGFDRDKDGIGDRPYEQFGYADRLWMDVNDARFFKGSPMLEVIDFLERLAPFSPPNLMLRDERPLMLAASAEELLRQSLAAGWGEQDGDVATGEKQGFDALKALKQSLGRP